MDDFVPATSRRELLRALTAAPVTVAAVSVPSPWRSALSALHEQYDDPPTSLVRSKEGRSLSRFRYHNAESFCWGLEEGLYRHDRAEMLYQSGIVVQLALSSHLLDMGFADEWNARHIRLDVAKSLAYANATGFGNDCTDMARLATILSPYWKWGHAHRLDEPRPDDGGFSIERVLPLLRALLDRVGEVTGHSCPKSGRRDQQEAQT